jgi:hypothetical protein
MATTTYTTRGSVRGCCGHSHRTMAAAVRCMMSDQAGCRTHGGYSDRVVRIIDGDDNDRAMTNDERHDYLDAEHNATR